MARQIVWHFVGFFFVTNVGCFPIRDTYLTPNTIVPTKQIKNLQESKINSQMMGCAHSSFRRYLVIYFFERRNTQVNVYTREENKPEWGIGNHNHNRNRTSERNISN